MNNHTMKSGYVAIIGRPNVGKSTMMNYMIGEKIAITSNKPQTTRNRIQTIYTDDRGQIIFLDTPGINKAKNKLGEYMLGAAVNTLKDADIILWIVETGTFIGTSEQMITEALKNIQKPVILAINKTDAADKEKIVETINLYSQAVSFSEIVPVSARTGHNMDELVRVLFQYLPEGPLYYDEDTLTDQPLKQIAAEIIREKALHLLQNEVPHGIAVTIERFKEGAGKYGELTEIEATIICEKDSHKGIIIGKNGSMLKKIGSSARFEMEKLMQGKVFLKLRVKVKKDWRDSDTQLKNFGYDPRA